MGGFDLGALLRNAAGPAAGVMAAHKRRDASLAEKQQQMKLAAIAQERQARIDEQQRQIGQSTIGYNDARAYAARNPATPTVRDPVADHAANRKFDVENPLPTAPRAPAGPEPLEVTIGPNGQRVYTPRSKAAGMTAPSPEPREPRAEPRDSFTPVTVGEGGTQVVKPFNTHTGETGESIGDAKVAGGMGQAGIKMKIAKNQQQFSVIDDALKELDAYPDAVGITRGLPILGDRLDQRVDPKGVAARASIANIGSLQIHDRTGAAMTIHEEPRLAPFVPNVGDKPETIRTKLKKLRAALKVETDALLQQTGGGGRAGGGGASARAGSPDLSALRQAAEAHLRAQGKTPEQILAELGPPEDEE